MCGIAGTVSRHTDGLPADRARLRRMCHIMRHRGPDDEGYYVDGGVGLGMRRLSIIDLETGQQPVSNEDGSIWLIFNGEIYNYRTMRKQLEQRGHRFRSQSDTEVIVHAYEEYGVRCVEQFNGMFAIALWDAQRRQLMLARDRLGIKPLYYWANDAEIVFASELKSLLVHPRVPRAVDHTALDLFLTLEYIPAPRTILTDVHKLLPGHILLCTPEALSIQEYWDIPVREMPGDMESYSEELAALVQDSVRMRLISDVPLGAFLSGGIDSSTVVAYMSAAMTRPVQAFSIGFGDPTYNELPYAQAVAARFGVDHHVETLQPEIGSLAERLISHLDEPLADFSIIPTYLVSQSARRHVTVALSGDGGDELFGGYETYVAQSLDPYYRLLPRPLRQQLLPALLQRVPPRPAKKGAVNKAKRFVEGASLPPVLQHTRWMMFMDADAKAQLYTDAMAEAFGAQPAYQVVGHYFRKFAAAPPLCQQQYVDVKTYLVDNILAKVDRMSMAASLEVRVPFLDHRIVELAVNLPPQMKLHHGQTKVILRRMMKGRLPHAVLTKPKQGFSIPIKQWLQGPLQPMMRDLLSPAAVTRRGLFRPEPVQRWIGEHLAGQVNHSHRLWALMVFELWMQRVLEQELLLIDSEAVVVQ